MAHIDGFSLGYCNLLWAVVIKIAQGKKPFILLTHGSFYMEFQETNIRTHYSCSMLNVNNAMWLMWQNIDICWRILYPLWNNISKYIFLMWMKYNKEYFLRFKVACSLNKNSTF
jgi:hypothetical protein